MKWIVDFNQELSMFIVVLIDLVLIIDDDDIIIDDDNDDEGLACEILDPLIVHLNSTDNIKV